MKNKAGGVFNLESSGFVFTSDSDDLKKILVEGFDKLSTSIITTPLGPGAFAPDTVTILQGLVKRLNLLFK